MCRRKYDIESLAELLFAEDAKHMNIFNTEYVTLFIRCYVLLDLGSAWWDDTVNDNYIAVLRWPMLRMCILN